MRGSILLGNNLKFGLCIEKQNIITGLTSKDLQSSKLYKVKL